LPDGRERVRIGFTPRDKYGNHLGPGRGDTFETAGTPGCTLEGTLVDLGDGSYTQTVVCDPDLSRSPGITITQPGRDAVVVATTQSAIYRYCVTFLCGEQPRGECDCAPVRPAQYATEINIHNYHDTEAAVRKYVVPVVLAGAVIGREPRVATVRAVDKIVLPPHAATMDDCCRLGELLFGATAHSNGLLSGTLEIVSRTPLAVTAVYTMRDPATGAVDIEVRPIAATPA
ncbi:MAG: hypothetical protein ABIU95_02715, partial [Burkholderiales bacterium]